MKNLAVLMICFCTLLLISACGDDKNAHSAADAAPGSTDTVYSDARGNVLTMADVNSFPVNIPPPRGLSMNVPPEARQLLQMARQHGGAGEHAEFLNAARRAAEAAPEWPRPWYDMAYSHLQREEYDLAREYFLRVDELAPEGFLYTKSALHTLDREAAGTLPAGFFKDFTGMLQEEDITEREEKLLTLTQLAPNYCPVWNALAEISNDPNQKLAYIERGLTAQCDAETYGMLQLNKAIILSGFNQKDEAVRLLGELLFNKSTTEFVRGMVRSAIRRQF